MLLRKGKPIDSHEAPVPASPRSARAEKRLTAVVRSAEPARPSRRHRRARSRQSSVYAQGRCRSGKGGGSTSAQIRAQVPVKGREGEAQVFCRNGEENDWGLANQLRRLRMEQWGVRQRSYSLSGTGRQFRE